MGTESTTAEGLQKINVKISLEVPSDFDYDVLLAIFGRWRLEEGEKIIDLADYLHVPEGPGCLLVSHLWQFGIDLGDGQPGLFYSSRMGLSGEAQERFTKVIRDCVEKSKRLLGESDIPQTIRPRWDEIEVIANDRVLAPNTDEIDELLRPGLTATLDRFYGTDGFTIEREKDPSLRLGYRVKAESADGLTFDEVLSRLGR